MKLAQRLTAIIEREDVGYMALCPGLFDLAERFRSATDPAEVKRLGDQMGRMVFGWENLPEGVRQHLEAKERT